MIRDWVDGDGTHSGRSDIKLEVRGGYERRVKYVRSLDKIPNIPPEERATLAAVAERYVFRANDYYLGLIDWNDPDDPIKQLIIPRREELNDWGALDACNEQSVTVDRGVQHKYPHTVLLLCNEVCAPIAAIASANACSWMTTMKSPMTSPPVWSTSPTTPR